MIKAGALTLVLAISLIMLSFLAAMMTMQQYSRQHAAEWRKNTVLERNLHSATQLLFAKEFISYEDTAWIDLFGYGTDTVSIIKKPWGAYEVGVANSYLSHDTLSCAMVMGTPFSPQERYALYIANEDRPLSVSGNTIIKGDAYLPPAGIRKAYIEGKSYEGPDHPVDGKIHESNAVLPSLAPALLNYLQSFFDTGNLVEPFPLPVAGDSIHHSFLHPTLFIALQNPAALSGMNLNGNIVIVSDSTVTITANNALEDVLFFAPCIIVEEGFKGSVQLFAKDSILVGKNCLLDYPSAVGLIPGQDDPSVMEFSPYIHIDSASTVWGAVFAQSMDSGHFMSEIRIRPGATVYGQIHAEGLLEMRGSAIGSTRCRRFKLQTPSTLYENFVLDATLNFKDLSPDYRGAPLLGSSGTRTASKWLAQ